METSRMASNGLRSVVGATFVALAIYASHIYAEKQAYKTGVYMGKAFFQTEDFKNQRCGSLPADSFRRVCEVHDLQKDSVMEDALASAQIIPALADSTALRIGFRDGWREARTATFANRDRSRNIIGQDRVRPSPTGNPVPPLQ